MVRQSRAHAEVQSDEAQLLAEAGLERARRALYLYKENGSYDWNQLLADHQYLSIDPADHWREYEMMSQYRPTTMEYYGTGDWYVEAPLPGESDYCLGYTQFFSEGGFVVIVRDNDDGDDDPLSDADGRLMLYVTASLPDGTQRQVEALVEYQPSDFVPDVAILVDGSLALNGNPEVQGALGSVHANSNLTILGDPTIEKDATTAGTLDVRGTPTVGGNLGKVPYVPVPEVQVSDYLVEADYVLKGNGDVLDASGAVIADGRMGWNNLKFVGGRWEIQGNAAPVPAAYYCETDLKIGGSPNVTATFFVQGSLSVTGDPRLRPFYKDVSVIVGGDLALKGTPAGAYEGFYYAYEQLKIAGNPVLNGSFVAKNAQDVSNAVSAGSAVDPMAGVVIGNPVITYNGGLDTGIPVNGSVQLRSMTRLK